MSPVVASALGRVRRGVRRVRERWLTPVAEQIAVGVIAAWLSALVDLVVTRVRVDDTPPPWSRLFETLLHLAATSAPFGVVLGLAAGATFALLRETAWLDGVRRGLDARRWTTPDPSRFGLVLAIPATLAALGLAARFAFLSFSERFHDQSLAAWAMAIAFVALAVAAVPLLAALHLVTRTLGRLAGSFGTPLGAALLLVGGALGALPLALAIERDVVQGIDVVAYLWAPGVLVVYGLVAIVVRLSTRLRARRRLGAVLSVVSVVLLAVSARSYGERGRVRELVEQRSITGQRLVRLYQGLTDRDGDGHSFAFGGDDCDDTDASVHPGAADVEGDGIDSDCFGGDGTPGLEDFVANGGFTRAPPETRGKNVLFVLVDALRPDHLGTHGYARPTSPNIDAFAEGAVVFEGARATSSRSVRSIPSMMTGLYASQLRYGSEYLYPGVRDENELLAEVLKDNGYQTAVSLGTDYFAPVHGFFQGFDEVVQLPRNAPRDEPVDRAIEMLERFESAERPWMLWVYFFNVHLPYLHDGRASAFGTEPMDAYDTEIQLADAQFQRLLVELERRGIRDDTVIVLVSDHGEAFLEHGNQGHSFTLYDEEVRSVLMIDAPGIEARRVEEPVLLLDVAPTLRNLLGLPAPGRVAGRSLVPLMTGEEVGRRRWAERPLFAELLPDGLFPFDQKTVVSGNDKLIWWVREGRRELYDLSRDPRERRDRADDEPERVQRLQALLRAFVAQGRTENRRHDVVARNLLPAVPPMQHRVDARFPGFTLLGYDFDVEQVRRGDVIPVTFYYRVEQHIDEDLFFYVDIRGPGNRQIPQFHAHHYPLNGSYRTDEWQPGEIIRDAVEIVVLDTVPTATDYDLSISIYGDGRRVVPFYQGSERKTHHPMGRFRVE
ncbi:MAG: sulfatase-like hydrolase/transferase [Sandaracinus sp.]|nr:sulfatase-like hydrolase/transferase [Myxococcales bacterium]MCB9601963.1 sulfatase-like hydrolase/transferase [Sandaracinus sp.]